MKNPNIDVTPLIENQILRYVVYKPHLLLVLESYLFPIMFRFFLFVAAESDMDLDLLAESESDSDSSHSNVDTTSVQRSAATQATAGSDAGMSFNGGRGMGGKVLTCHITRSSPRNPL